MKSKAVWTCLFVFVCILSSSLLSEVPGSEDENEIKLSAPVSLNDLPEDSLIARVLDQKVYFKDINPSQAQIKKYQKDKTPEQLKQFQKQQRVSALSNYFRVFYEKYVQQQGIEVTEKDVEGYNESMLRTIELQVKSSQRKVNSLQKELQADNLDDEKRLELNGRLELYTNNVARMTESKRVFQSPNRMVERMILMWKINNYLYEQYGGRVIFQQAGPEPLDAYRKFFENEQRKGSFEFFNKEVEGLFWEYYRNEKMHTFYPDEVEAKAMMQTPWWLREPDEPLEGKDAGLWGECVKGLCIKIQPKKLVFNSEETAKVIVDLLNIGDKIFSCSSWQQVFEIEVDGQWYRWNGPEEKDVLSLSLRPKKVQYEFAEIQLTGQWVSKETGNPLKLDEGRHSLRFHYRPIYEKPHDKDVSAEAMLAVTSNLISFKIIPFEEPLSILLEGESEVIRQIMKWLAKNPKIVRPVLGQKYIVRRIPPKKGIDHKITIVKPDSDIDFKIEIIDPSGNKQNSEIRELNQKLGELIKKHLPEQFQKP